MTPQPVESPRLRRRRLLLGGAAALVVLYAVGAATMVPRIGRDLASRVADRLEANGFAARVEFSGQDGVLRCAAPLDDPLVALQLAKSVSGVHHVSLDESCRGATTPTTIPPATSTPATTTPASTIPVTSTTEAVSTTTSAPATSTTVPASLLKVSSADGKLVLAGSVASDAQHQTLLAAASVVDPTNLDDQLTVDPSAPVTDSTVALLTYLVKALPAYLVSGEVTVDGMALTATGVYADEAGKASFEKVAGDVGATVTLSPRPTATTSDAASLEGELNTLVAAEPILFDKGSSTISVSSRATIEKVAGIAKRFAGVAIEVQGHTDSEGDAARNLTLSQQRADAVMAALVALGVPQTDLTAKGYGETQLILDAGGNEVPDKSRRVVFGVVATS